MLFLQHKGGVDTPGDLHNSGVCQHQQQEDNCLDYLSGVGRRGENRGCTEDYWEMDDLAIHLIIPHTPLHSPYLQ